MIITIEELFRKLSYGELANLAVAVEANGAIKKDRHDQLIHFINEGMLKLHTKFPLAQQVVELDTTGITSDGLDVTLNSNVIQVISIMNVWGNSIPFELQKIANRLYVYGGILHIPETSYTELQVAYQLRHDLLNRVGIETYDVNDPDHEKPPEVFGLDQTIDLIPDLVEALTAYVAYKVYGNIKTSEGQAASLSYKNRVLEVCAEAQAAGVLPGEILPQGKFESRGWV